MAHGQHTPTLASLEEAITVLFCLVDDTYTLLNPDGRSHESLKRLSGTPRSLPLRSSSSCGASRASGPSCARRKGSSRTCFSGRGGDAPLLFAPPGEEAQALLLGTLAP
jgi:hypothetical protein